MGFLSVPNLVPWLIFNVNILSIKAWILTDRFCWIGLYSNFNLAGRGWKKEKKTRGVGAIIQGMAIIQGNSQ